MSMKSPFFGALVDATYPLSSTVSGGSCRRLSIYEKSTHAPITALVDLSDLTGFVCPFDPPAPPLGMQDLASCSPSPAGSPTSSTAAATPTAADPVLVQRTATGASPHVAPQSHRSCVDAANTKPMTDRQTTPDNERFTLSPSTSRIGFGFSHSTTAGHVRTAAASASSTSLTPSASRSDIPESACFAFAAPQQERLVAGCDVSATSIAASSQPWLPEQPRYLSAWPMSSAGDMINGSGVRTVMGEHRPTIPNGVGLGNSSSTTADSTKDTAGKRSYTKLFVGQIPVAVEPKSWLADLFAPYAVRDIITRRVSERTIAFVWCGSRDFAAAAVDALDGLKYEAEGVWHSLCVEPSNSFRR